MSALPISVKMTLWAAPTFPEPEQGGARALEVLRTLKRLAYFREGFEGSDPPPNDERAYLEAAADGAFVTERGLDAHIFMARKKVEDRSLFHLFVVSEPGLMASDRVEIEFREIHLAIALDAFLLKDIVAALLPIFQAQHLSVLPAGYAADHRATSAKRLPLGWVGWVPFSFDSDQVPEAELIVPMEGGSFLAAQTPYFSAYGEAADLAAIGRAQALEVRLNALRALPSRSDLASGNWGDLR